MNYLRIIALYVVASPALLSSAAAQWQTPAHSVPLGRGAGVQGLGSVGPCPAGQVIVSTGASSDPVCGGGFISSTSAVAGASTTYTAAQNNVLVARSNSGSPMIDTLPGTSPGVLPAQTFFTIENSDAAGILAVNVGAGTSLAMQPSPTGWLYLCPGQSVSIYSDGTAYRALSQSAACVLKAPATFFAAAAGGLATNHGLTAAAPLNNITNAYNLARGILDANLQTVTIQAADGAYGKTVIAGQIPGQGIVDTVSGSFPVVIQGDVATPTNATITLSSGNIYGAVGVYNASVLIQGFSLSSSLASSYDLYATWFSTVAFKSMNFGSTGGGGVQIAANLSATVEIAGNYTYTGSANSHWVASNSATISVRAPSVTITATGSPSFAACFACAQYPSMVVMDFTPTFAGSAVTGPRYSVNFNGIINTGSAGNPNFFPGSTAGTSSTGGQYN